MKSVADSSTTEQEIVTNVSLNENQLHELKLHIDYLESTCVRVMKENKQLRLKNQALIEELRKFTDVDEFDTPASMLEVITPKVEEISEQITVKLEPQDFF